MSLFPSSLGRYAVKFLSSRTNTERVQPVAPSARAENKLRRGAKEVGKCCRKGCNEPRLLDKLCCRDHSGVHMTETLDNMRVIPPALDPCLRPLDGGEERRQYFDRQMRAAAARRAYEQNTENSDE